jgi:predicted nucleic acid-binding protein
LVSVIDASVFVKWYLRDEDLVHEARLLFERYSASADPLACPHFARYELATALTRATREGRTSATDAAAAMQHFEGLPIVDQFDSQERIQAAVSNAHRYRISVYDGLYLAYAEELQARLVTTDIELLQRTAGAGADVIHLSAI